jgi:adenylate cyclase
MTAQSANSDVVVSSILFTDLVGFTEFNGAVGDIEAARVLDMQSQIVMGALASCSSGRVVKEIGDGLMLSFGSPIEALACSIAILCAVDAARAGGTFPLAMRMGIHHGAAIARGDDLVGQTVNIAARVSDLAGPGELLVSDSVIHAHGEQPPPNELSPIGPAHVKGVDEPIWLHRLTV